MPCFFPIQVLQSNRIHSAGHYSIQSSQLKLFSAQTSKAGNRFHTLHTLYIAHRDLCELQTYQTLSLTRQHLLAVLLFFVFCFHQIGIKLNLAPVSLYRLKQAFSQGQNFNWSSLLKVGLQLRGFFICVVPLPCQINQCMFCWSTCKDLSNRNILMIMLWLHSHHLYFLAESEASVLKKCQMTKKYRSFESWWWGFYQPKELSDFY